jgi:hypothetical protein
VSGTETDRLEFEAWKSKRDADKIAAEAAAKPPQVFVWLANGEVKIMDEADSQASHVDELAVVARYPVGG